MNTHSYERCGWCGTDPIYTDYHDQEWGVPIHGERDWFEFLILEGAQAGLSWITILKKRPAYRLAFDNFEPALVARYDAAKQQELLTNPGIVRNRLKIAASIQNAQAFLNIQEQYGSFDSYIWRFVNGKPVQNSWKSLADVPAQTPTSEAISRDLLKHGLRFVGPTIIYALMQATGMVNDHVVSCFRYQQLSEC